MSNLKLVKEPWDLSQKRDGFMGSVNSLLRISATENAIWKGFPTFLGFPIASAPCCFLTFSTHLLTRFFKLIWLLSEWILWDFYIFQTFPVENKWWVGLTSLWPTPYCLANSLLDSEVLFGGIIFWKLFLYRRKRTLLEMDHSLSCLICLVVPCLNSFQNKWGGEELGVCLGLPNLDLSVCVPPVAYSWED